MWAHMPQKLVDWVATWQSMGPTCDYVSCLLKTSDLHNFVIGNPFSLVKVALESSRREISNDKILVTF